MQLVYYMNVYLQKVLIHELKIHNTRLFVWISVLITLMFIKWIIEDKYD